MAEQFIKPTGDKKKLLLHSCCAPCSTACIEALINYFSVTVFYYNPNITEFNEYEKRKNEQIRLIKEHFSTVQFIEGNYNPQEFFSVAKNLEKEREGGKRCEKCIELRLKKTLETAQELGFDVFCSTLSVSPHKNAKFINETGKTLAKNSKVKYLETDFKKNGGFLRSVELSKNYGLYRQNFCGCIYSELYGKNNQETGVK